MISKSTKESYKKQVRLFKLLNHPARLAILDILRVDEACVCHIEAVLGYRQAYISQQLAALRKAGIVQDRRDGWNVFYRAAEMQIYQVIDAARQVLGMDAPINEKGLTPPSCPCPKCNPES